MFNNGKGIPVVRHKVENVYVPELIFGTLLTSSNYDDSERKVTGNYIVFKCNYNAVIIKVASVLYELARILDARKIWEEALGMGNM